MKTLHIKASKLCEKLVKLERRGQYEDALSEIGDLWQDKTELPNTEGLPQSLAAEVILRCGSLFGFLGPNEQITDPQEKSRNLLTTARNLFLESNNDEKLAECENYLALTYWRTGELNEALIWLTAAFSHPLPTENENRIYSYIIKALVLHSAQHPIEVLKTLLPVETVIANCSDFCLKGAFYNQLGNAWENLGDVSKALRSLERAMECFHKARHDVYYGAALNDLAYLNKTIGDFDKAHQMVDTSTQTFRKIKDHTREGFSLDTKAGIYFSEGKFDIALKTVDEAIEILRSSENSGYLVNTFGTKIKLLIAMDDISNAAFCLTEAVETAKTRIGEAAANNLIKDYETCLRKHLGHPKNISSEEKTSAQNAHGEDLPVEWKPFDGLELILPPSLSMYEDIQGIWINNTHLENAGLVRDSLAVVASTGEVQRGDLTALEEIETGNVSCGFYDFGFGIVCLEGYDCEPLLFDKEKINIIGKIVGVATRRTPDGKLIVEPVTP